MTAPDKVIGQVSDWEEEPELEYLQPEVAVGLKKGTHCRALL